MIERGLTVERLDKRQAESKSTVGNEHVAAAALSPQLGRRETEDAFHDPAHLPHAAKPGRSGDDGHRKVGLVEQAPGEVRASGPADERRSRPDMLFEEPA